MSEGTIIPMALNPKALGEIVRRRRHEKGWSQEKLAKETGASQSTIDRIERGDFKRLPSDIPTIADALSLDLTKISHRLARLQVSVENIENLSRQIGEAAAERELPPLKVFAAAEGGAGEMVVSTDPIEFIPRPSYLGNVKEGFAVLVTGESMVPAFDPGDLAIVNPRLPLVRNKDVILISGESAAEFKASIKRLLRWTEDTWFLEQFNPPPGQKREFTLSKKAWPKALRVVGKHYAG